MEKKRVNRVLQEATTFMLQELDAEVRKAGDLLPGVARSAATKQICLIIEALTKLHPYGVKTIETRYRDDEAT